jgi:GMP synthase-like glutamine amidotransferase
MSDNLRILVLQHAAIEHPGIFRTFWRKAGHRITTVLMDAGESLPPLAAFDLMVVMGGPQDVWQEERFPWLAAEKAAIRHWVYEIEKPYLGICLGHQLLASALGGTVEKMPRPEVGLAPVTLTPEGLRDPVLTGFTNPVESFHWHGAGVSKPPAGAVILAGNEACPVQAIRVGRHAYGFQYHCEIEASTVADWSTIPAYHASLMKALGEDGAARLPHELLERLPAFHARAERLNANLMKLIATAAS